MNFKELFFSLPLSTHKSIYDVAMDKGLAKIGDSLVNLTFSLAKSVLSNKVTGNKVPGRILSYALRKSKLRTYAGRHRDAHGLADSVEALVAYCWLKNKITLEEIVNILIDGIKSSPGNSTERAISAFTMLLERITVLLEGDVSFK